MPNTPNDLHNAPAAPPRVPLPQVAPPAAHPALVTAAPSSPAAGSASAPPAAAPADNSLHDQIIAALRQVYDPEIPVNIYELGLIYAVDLDAAGNVSITMTLTSPACPSAQELPLAVRSSVGRLPGVSSCEVEIVFDPPWTPEKMSTVAKVTLGMM